MANIAWNGDELQTITNNINECLKLLQVQQAHLEKLQAQTQDGWNSEAGRIYAERIEGDLAEIRQSVDLFSSAVNRLQQGARQLRAGRRRYAARSAEPVHLNV